MPHPANDWLRKESISPITTRLLSGTIFMGIAALKLLADATLSSCTISTSLA
jgi:hypothetical protein